ncbi:MAG: GntR family transcriptional regulator, partial [Bryobacteraceae bacterium]
TGLDPVNFKGIRERIADALRQAIIDGSLRPGESLKDTVLATRFNVSRSPVREALLVLEKESLVKNYHNQGWFVIDLSESEIAEITSFRAVLEVLVLQAAAAKVQPSQLRELEDIERKFRAALEGSDMPNVSRQDADFHRLLWRIAGIRLLEETLVQLTSPYFAYMQAALRTSGVSIEDLLATARNHESFIDYLRGVQDRSAKDLIREHFAAMKLPHWDGMLNLLSSGG